MDYKNYHRDRTYSENESLFRNIFTKRFLIAQRFLKKPGRVLDIGTSTGVMLDIFRDNGWETWGVEPSQSASEARSRGHRIENTFFEKAKLPKGYFDLVIMNHTLEHLDGPIRILKRIHSVLKEGGLVYIDVPNAGSVASRLLKDKWPYRLPLEHKQQFTRHSLAKVFRQAGFEVVHFESRSGIFEMAYPVKEILESLLTLKKRFFTNLLLLPYAFFVTLLNSGDSMSMIGRKNAN